jgi:hypothetical protein
VALYSTKTKCDTTYTSEGALQFMKDQLYSFEYSSDSSFTTDLLYVFQELDTSPVLSVSQGSSLLFLLVGRLYYIFSINQTI